MKVKAVGKTHLLLILSAAEARLLGISTCCGCAMLLRTRLPLFRYGVCTPHRFHCRMMPQVFSLPTASVLLDCVAHLCRVPHLFRSATLYQMDNGYHLVVIPTCRHLFSLRSLMGEYSTQIGNTAIAAAHTKEQGRLLSQNILQDIGRYFSP